MLRSGAPVLGDEQVLDIELDRNTVFPPVANSTQGLDPWNLYNESPRTHIEPEPAFPGVCSSHVLVIGSALMHPCLFVFFFCSICCSP
jgi:hypothetical protein